MLATSAHQSPGVYYSLLSQYSWDTFDIYHYLLPKTLTRAKETCNRIDKMQVTKSTVHKVERLTLTIALGALLASCDSKNDEQTQAEEASKEIATTEAIKKHPGCKALETIAKESGTLTIEKQKYAEANKSVVFYYKPHFFDIAKENDSLILSFNDYFSDINYRIECKEEQLTTFPSEKDGFKGNLLVFFTVSGFRKPIFSMAGNSESGDGSVDVYLEDNDALIGSGSLVEIVNLDK